DNPSRSDERRAPERAGAAHVHLRRSSAASHGHGLAHPHIILFEAQPRPRLTARLSGWIHVHPASRPALPAEPRPPTRPPASSHQISYSFFIPPLVFCPPRDHHPAPTPLAARGAPGRSPDSGLPESIAARCAP